jgi:hypothetical protein
MNDALPPIIAALATGYWQLRRQLTEETDFEENKNPYAKPKQIHFSCNFI